jgi:endonuclease YncB( thermonuclease family)
LTSNRKSCCFDGADFAGCSLMKISSLLQTTLKLCLIILLQWTFGCSVPSRTISGRVVGVSDGDTITVLDRNQQEHKIRLNGIDAPESGQDFGQASKQNLSKMVFGKEVTVAWDKLDRYGRILGKVTAGGLNVNLEQIRAGYAWYFINYAADVSPLDRPAYERAEQEARSARRGLWQQPSSIPPWEWREQRRGESPITAEPAPRPSSGQIIGNRNTRVYHRPDCPDYQKVSEKNRVYFSTTEEAEYAGFRPAGNCPLQPERQ